MNERDRRITSSFEPHESPQSTCVPGSAERVCISVKDIEPVRTYSVEHVGAQLRTAINQARVITTDIVDDSMTGEIVRAILLRIVRGFSNDFLNATRIPPKFSSRSVNIDGTTTHFTFAFSIEARHPQAAPFRRQLRSSQALVVLLAGLGSSGCSRRSGGNCRAENGSHTRPVPVAIDSTGNQLCKR